MTVHFLDEGIDSGPVILQESVPVEPDDTRETLHGRIRAVEHRLLPEAVRLYLAGPYAPNSVRRALISVFDKTGLDEFAAGLAELGVELVASGGTAAYISELGLAVTPVDELTDVPELLGGRVKTLHPEDPRRDPRPARPGGRRSTRSPSTSIDPFDLVCVNLYPFAAGRRKKDVREEEAVEMIDIGGPAMLRAAAKNFVHVAPVCLLARYGPVLEELRLDGDLSAQTRRELAAEAFAHTAAYEASIAGWFADRETFPPRLIVSLERGPRPAVRREPASAGGLLLGGRRPPRTCFPASSSCRARSSPSTTSPTSMRPARSCASSSSPPVQSSSTRIPVASGVAADLVGGLREGLRRRPGLGLRGRRRRQPTCGPAAREAPRRAVRRGAHRPRVHRRRRRDRRTETCHSDSGGPRAAPCLLRRAPLPPRARRLLVQDADADSR